MNQKKLQYNLILSAIGAILIIIISWFSSSNMKNIQMSDKMLVGGAFILSCISGIYLAIKPDLIKRFPERDNKEQIQTKMRGRQGHHPDCEQFKSHTIRIRNKILCLGCIGLALGSIISIFLTSIYIVFIEEIAPSILQILIISGIVFIAFNYLETVIHRRIVFLHLISNVFLVVGFFLVTIGIYHSTGSTVYGFFGIIISFLWLDTRIKLSSWHHSEICFKCSENCKVY